MIDWFNHISPDWRSCEPLSAKKNTNWSRRQLEDSSKITTTKNPVKNNTVIPFLVSWFALWFWWLCMQSPRKLSFTHVLYFVFAAIVSFSFYYRWGGFHFCSSEAIIECWWYKKIFLGKEIKRKVVTCFCPGQHWEIPFFFSAKIVDVDRIQKMTLRPVLMLLNGSLSWRIWEKSRVSGFKNHTHTHTQKAAAGSGQNHTTPLPPCTYPVAHYCFKGKKICIW